jgi:methylglutaconyl-CoA hydratase
VKIGFVPAIVTAILRRNVSEKVAFDLITRGIEFSADEAFRLGLVNRLFHEESFPHDVKEHAAVYKTVSRSAVAMSKRLLYEMDGMNFEDALEAGAKTNAAARMTEDCKRGIAKFLEK